MRTSVAFSHVVDCSAEKKSPSDIVATCVRESAGHAPSLCGFFWANFLTGPATRRSELPSRRTGLTAEPSTFEYFSLIAFSASSFGS